MPQLISGCFIFWDVKNKVVAKQPTGILNLKEINSG